MATLLGEKVGETVGYRVKMDAKVGPHSRIEVITEGVLTPVAFHDDDIACDQHAVVRYNVRGVGTKTRHDQLHAGSFCSIDFDCLQLDL